MNAMRQPMETSIRGGRRILMLLENNPYPADCRVRQEAQSLVQAGYDVTVICPKGTQQPWYDVINCVRVYRFPPPPKATGFLGYIWEYGYAMVAMFCLSLWVYLRHGFDVVHAHNPPDTQVVIALLYKALGKRFVFDHHDLSPEMYIARFGEHAKPWIYRLLLFFEKFSCRLADQVIATNQSYRQLTVQRSNVAPERITIVRNGPDLTCLRPVDIDPTLRRPGKTTLCYVGEMGVHDGVDYLLRALGHLLRDLGRRDFFCLLVGSGDAWPYLQSLAAKLVLTDYVCFTGRVKHTEVARYLSAADICVAPEPANPYNDRSTMIKVLEYLTLGKPVVAFDLPEHRVTAQEAAVYAHPNDALDFARLLAALMDDPQRRQHMGTAGRQRVENALAWSYQEQHLLHMYQRLIGKDTR
jgi:glycosyltransferase involved in cell wall biosynthesis